MFKHNLSDLSTMLSFDDVLIKPMYSGITPDKVSLESNLAGMQLKIPIFSAAMDTVSESQMGIAMADFGGCAVIHKNMTIARQVKEVKEVIDNNMMVAAAIGATGNSFERAEELIKAGATAITVDTAHGHSKNVIEMVKRLRRQFPSLIIIAGNIATPEGGMALRNAGASIVKVGIGPGSICTTRIVSGCGVPQLSAIYDVARALKGTIPIIADGGIRTSGDAVKALAAGAHAIMLGSMLAGTDEAPGKVIIKNGEKHKSYRGMGSKSAMEAGSADRYSLDKVESDKRVPEGIEAYVKYKGPVATILCQMDGGIRSGFGYTGAKDIEELHKKVKFIRITAAGLAESHPHSV